MNKLFVLAAVAMAALVSHGSYLYWQIDNDESKGEAKFTYATVSLEKTAAMGDYVRLSVYDPGAQEPVPMGQYVYHANYPAEETGYYTGEVFSGDQAGGAVNLVGQYEGSMLVEMWAYDELTGEDVVVASQIIEKSGWQDYVYEDMSTVGDPLTVHAKPVPEPTSGLLLLLGSALLALKRKSRSRE